MYRECKLYCVRFKSKHCVTCDLRTKTRFNMWIFRCSFSFVSPFGRISCYRWHFQTCRWQVEGIFSAISWVNIYFIRLFCGIGPFYNITIGVNVFSSLRVDENIIFTLHFAFDTDKPIDRSRKNIWEKEN